MPTQSPRFELRRTQAGALLIRDNKDESVVAFVHKGKRALEHTQKMGETMTAALNAAVTVKQVKEPQA